jgi:hypothetical protein
LFGVKNKKGTFMKRLICLVLIALTGVISVFAQNRPDWVNSPGRFGRANFENGATTSASLWYYFMSQSQASASEKRARSDVRLHRARLPSVLRQPLLPRA